LGARRCAAGCCGVPAKGFSTAAGVIGGLLLGPLAFLMFFVSGVTRDDQRRKCPACAEFIKADATVCEHCRTQLGGAPTVSTRDDDFDRYVKNQRR
jgi:hypothetical protein